MCAQEKLSSGARSSGTRLRHIFTYPVPPEDWEKAKSAPYGSVVEGGKYELSSHRQKPWRIVPHSSDEAVCLDVCVPEGTPIYAVADGEVAYVTGEGESDATNSGNFVRLVHHTRCGVYWTKYSHMMFWPEVRPGQLVLQGELLGLVGSTGEGITIPHLHLEIDKVFTKDRTRLCVYQAIMDGVPC